MPVSSGKTKNFGASSGSCTISTTSAGPTRPIIPSRARKFSANALYACDELAGLITAAALVRPNGITDLTASSVKKKMKSKGFARNVRREDIERGAADFGVDLTEHIQFVIDAMKPHAEELGLLQGPAGETSFDST